MVHKLGAKQNVKTPRTRDVSEQETKHRENERGRETVSERGANGSEKERGSDWG
jgi:hypothetical protein